MSHSVAAELVGHQFIRDDASLQHSAEEPFSRPSVTSLLHLDVDRVPFLVDGPPQVQLLAVDLDEHLVQIPGVVGPLSPLEAPSILRSELPAPLPDRLVADLVPRSASKSSTSRKLRPNR